MEDGVVIGNINIPAIKGAKGDKGDAGKISSLAITMLASTATPTVTNNGTVYDAQYVLGIPRGASISSTEINEDNELVITLDDGTEINVGVVVGSSISSVYIDENYDLIVELTDDTSITAGNLETMLEFILDDYYTKSEVYNKDEADELLGNMFTVIKEHSARSLSLFLNTSTYVLTVNLNDWNGATLDTKTVDLPLESMVVSGSYDSVNKKVVLTLQSGSTVEFSVADLVSGLQTEITSSNKLSADLVDDTSATNKFVTASDKTAWNAKLDQSDLTNYVTNTDYATSSVGGVVKVSPQYKATNITSGGTLEATTKTYEQYSSLDNTIFISKGTLENVLNAKIGSIDSVLDAINGEVI